MASAGLNKWIVSGNLAADAQLKTVELRNGETAQLATATLYVQKPRDRDESFTVSLSIWQKSTAWRKLPYLKKGSLIICTGSVEPNPFISSNGNIPKAGLQMTVLDIDLDIIRKEEDEEALPVDKVTSVPQSSTQTNPKAATTSPAASKSAATASKAPSGTKSQSQTPAANGAKPTAAAPNKPATATPAASGTPQST